MAEAKKEKMVEREVTKVITLGGKEVPPGKVVRVSEANAEIFKDRLCKPGESKSGAVEPDAELTKQVEELEADNKTLTEANEKLTNQVEELTKAAGK